MIPCCICSLSFNEPENMCSHIRKHHRGVNEFRCTICNKVVFTELWKYKRHLLNVCFQPTPAVLEHVCDASESNNFSKFEKEVDDAALAFVLKLASNMSIPRNHTFEVLRDFQRFYSTTVLKGFDKYVVPHVQKDGEVKVANFIQICKDPFRSIDTESKLNSVLEAAELISPLQVVDINDDIESPSKSKGGILMPLAFQFKKFFELPGVFEKSQKFTQEISQSNDISHFINASVWKQKLKLFKASDIVIPFHLHVDDTQMNNALGSHRSKGLETCCYYSFPSIPPQYGSRLENIFSAELISSETVKAYGNLACFHDLVDELNKIAHCPITLNIDGKAVEVYFVLGLVLGDNKGINDLGGFAKSHSANMFCRFCTLRKTQTQVKTTENVSKMRNPENYDRDLRKENPKLTGIVEDSVLNLIFLCHATVCLGIDMMHDVFEGILHYNLCAIIKKFIADGYITLAQCNQLKSDFDYGEVESGDKSTNITLKKLKSNKLLMSASEMQSFFHHFGLIVGHLIPKNDKTWKFYLQTTKFLDLLYLPSYSERDLLNLTSTISKMNDMYKKLFNETLKPKHHYVTHYPTMIKRFGPLYYISSMRYEAKHKMLKNYTKNTTSRVFMSLSLGKKLQYNFACRLLSNDGLNDRVIMGPSSYINIIRSKLLDQLDEPQLLQHVLDQKTKETKKVTINGIHFSTELCIVLKKNGKLTLQKIEKIIYCRECISDVFFICKEFEAVSFNKNYECYDVNTSCTVDGLKSISAKDALKERQHPVKAQIVTGSGNFRFRARPF